MKVNLAFIFAALLCSLGAASAGAQTLPEKRPEVPVSIANVRPDHIRDGPMFNRAKAAFLAARDENASNFDEFWTKDAKLELVTFTASGSLERKKVDASFFRALSASCDGPLSYDEGRDWVELNWVCSVDPNAPIARHYVFRESPEIVMLVQFDGDRIRSLDAMEPMMIPGKKRLAMNAYASVHGNK